MFCSIREAYNMKLIIKQIFPLTQRDFLFDRNIFLVGNE